MRKKIAIVDPSSRSLPYCFYYVQSVARFYEIDFYCSQGKYNAHFLECMEHLENVHVHRFEVSSENKIVGLLAYIKLHMVLLSRKYRYSSIHFQWVIFPWIDMFLMAFYGGQLKLTFHNEVPHGYSGAWYCPFYMLAHIARGIAFVSPSTRLAFLAKYGNRFAVKSTVFNHGAISIDPYLPFPEMTNGASLSRLVFWGNVKEYKGLKFLCDALSAIGTLGVSVEVYGKFDSDQKYLISSLDEAGVKYVDGFLSERDVHGLLSGKGVCLVLPYKKATQSGVMYTAMHYALPFICSDSGDNATFLRGIGHDRAVFSYGDTSSLISSIHYIRENALSFVESLGVERGKYSWDYPLPELDRFYS